MSDYSERPAQYASAPCFAHELTCTENGFVAVDEETVRDVNRWRRAERDRLIKARPADPAERRRMTEQIVAGLNAVLAELRDPVVSVYWPMKGEPDLRPWMRQLAEQGVRVALPVVETKKQPMIFRQWTPQAKLVPGIWDIPVPAEGAVLTPDVVVSPLVGFDAACYRLGYGGGDFDRTLAAMTPRPLVVGVGYGRTAIATIFPLPHDIPMDRIITEAAPAIVRQTE